MGEYTPQSLSLYLLPFYSLPMVQGEADRDCATENCLIRNRIADRQRNLSLRRQKLQQRDQKDQRFRVQKMLQSQIVCVWMGKSAHLSDILRVVVLRGDISRSRIFGVDTPE